MSNEENPNIGPWMNVPGTTQPWHTSPNVSKSPYYKDGVPPIIAGANAYQMMYPDIYYRIQPYIMMAIEEMMALGGIPMPSREMVDQVVDRIYEDMRRMYPDMTEYAAESEKNAVADSPIQPFRRRGMFKDLISILLLSEFFRRRRRMPYDWY